MPLAKLYPVVLSRLALDGKGELDLRAAVEELQELAYRMTEAMYERLSSDDESGSRLTSAPWGAGLLASQPVSRGASQPLEARLL